ncbi:LysR family transcriptional regulator [Caulobacter sp. RHG1]|uniref:LysR family transcriptional regulator n=1 Tax=Caulobacter sp. (strain RHG1) TaxID=2545762 RepID=UPI00155373E9|nr:LysR family transcriptional regulator [Caulobacter sp. RHG1]NQE64693.1 Transcriptional regulator, LysR family [Caulobacter sp. RHG1]
MARVDLGDLTAFAAVARERNFTRAAAQLGLSQSALSHRVRALEERLDVRLLTRTTRSVGLTEAGERLLRTLAPRLEEIEAEIEGLTQHRDRPAGTVRINTSENAATMLLWPALERMLPRYPDIKVELFIEAGLSDIVAERFDAGVRLGEQVAKDMIAVRIGPDLQMAAVASPAYLAGRPRPAAPDDLASHDCINLRLNTLGGLYAWEFEKDGRELSVRVEGRLTFNSPQLVAAAAVAGYGVGFLPEDHVAEPLNDGRLVRLLEDWCPRFSGYHLYFPHRRQQSLAFATVVEALRWTG